MNNYKIQLANSLDSRAGNILKYYCCGCYVLTGKGLAGSNDPTVAF